MMIFDYTASAELFAAALRPGQRRALAYRRFPTAAEAIQYAIEAIPAPLLSGTVLEVGEDRYDARLIRELYDNAAYPLSRS